LIEKKEDNDFVSFCIIIPVKLQRSNLLNNGGDCLGIVCIDEHGSIMVRET
jgi:hypothetical protein